MRSFIAALLVLLACPALAEQVIETTSGEPIFLASGQPRTAFARAYIPDGGANADVFARDLGYLGIDHGQYVRLTDGNILQALQDPDMVAVVPASLLGAAPVGFLFDGGYFAFQATPEGLVPLSVRRPDGAILEAVDLGPLAAAPPPVIGPERRRTTLVAAPGLPTTGAVDFDLYSMRADRALLAQVLGKAGLGLGQARLAAAERVAEGPRPGGPALMFMAASQNDPALAGVMARGDLAFYAVTNFGLVPARPAAAGPAPAPSAPIEEAPEPAADAAPPAGASTVAAAPAPGITTPSRKGRRGGQSQPEEDASEPPAPDPLAGDLPPAVPARLDPTDYDAVILVTPRPLRPEALKRIELVWRFVVGQGAGQEDIRFYRATEKDRVNAMLARIAAATEAAPKAGGVFATLKFPGGAAPDQVVENLARTARGLILRLEDLSSPALAFFREDPRFAFWQPAADGFARVEIAPPPDFAPVALTDLPDAAPVALVRAGTAPGAASSLGELFLASREAGGWSPSPALHRRDSPDDEGRQRFGRFLGRAPEDFIRTGIVVELDPETGAIPEPWPADMILMTASDLRAPLLEDVLTGADAYLVAFGRLTPVTGAPPVADAAPEDAKATRLPRAALAAEMGPLIALPRDGGEHLMTLGGLSPYALFIEPAGGGFRLVSNGWKGAERITSLAALIDMNDPQGTRARLSEAFAQPNAAVFINHNPDAVPANDLGHPIYDALFDGSRRFVRLTDGAEVTMPTHPAFAPPAAPEPGEAGAFCGESGAFALYLVGQPREPLGALASDLKVIPRARAGLDLNHFRLVRSPEPGQVREFMDMRTLIFSSPAVAWSHFGSEAICERASSVPID